MPTHDSSHLSPAASPPHHRTRTSSCRPRARTRRTSSISSTAHRSRLSPRRPACTLRRSRSPSGARPRRSPPPSGAGAPAARHARVMGAWHGALGRRARWHGGEGGQGVAAAAGSTAWATRALGMRSRGSSTWEDMALSIPLPSLETAALTALWCPCTSSCSPCSLTCSLSASVPLEPASASRCQPRRAEMSESRPLTVGSSFRFLETWVSSASIDSMSSGRRFLPRDAVRLRATHPS